MEEVGEHCCFEKHGGGERVRTDDLLRARQALSQLSYTPNLAWRTERTPACDGTCVTLYALSWWAWMELNHRPHAYQACALTKLSYRPIEIRNYEFGFWKTRQFILPNPLFQIPNSIRPIIHLLLLENNT